MMYIIFLHATKYNSEKLRAMDWFQTLKILLLHVVIHNYSMRIQLSYSVRKKQNT